MIASTPQKAHCSSDSFEIETLILSPRMRGRLVPSIWLFQMLQIIPVLSFLNQAQRHVHQVRECHTPLFLSSLDDSDVFSQTKNGGFSLDLALFSAGLAFDAYVEPPATSSRWERGSKGMDVAFVSPAFTRNLYKGMVEITPLTCSGLPEEDDNMEAIMSGNGVDAAVLVAAIEGQWKEDIELLKQGYHEGIMDLTGAAHIGRSSTAWSNINERKSQQEKMKTGKAPAYHIQKSWGKDASAVWPEEDPFYIYVQDPANVKLLFTIFDDDVIGEGSAIGSTYIDLPEVLPQVRFSQEQMISNLKQEVIRKIQAGEISPDKIDEEVARAVEEGIKPWEGDLKMTSKPRIKNKNSQVAMGMAAGAMVAGPMGAALGAAVGSFYEGMVKGRVKVRLRYLPIPASNANRDVYTVTGGMPGIDWGDLYNKYLQDNLGLQQEGPSCPFQLAGADLEHCFFINHSKTGACCAVYRSLERKLIVVSFRGTCAPIDLVTDASIVQEAWVEGEERSDEDIAKVHVGFRSSLNSISRRLKELLLVTIEPHEKLSDYNVLVTGHSLGAALATLFTADIGEFGIDAGRALPTAKGSEAWWKGISNIFLGDGGGQQAAMAPPRPKGLYVYNFGSPRVGNRAFSDRFNKILEQGHIDHAYRMVNGEDVVARMPRTMRTLSVDYDHCGSTVVVETATEGAATETYWVEGESDDASCPIRDSSTVTMSPVAEGTLLGDLFSAIKQNEKVVEAGESSISSQDGPAGDGNQIKTVFSRVQERLSTVTAADITSLIGINKSYSQREFKMVQALFTGEALAHHMEDSYYNAMGRAGGFDAKPNEAIVRAGVSTETFVSQAESESIAAKAT